ncbi:hypothetical protein DPMN_113436 [Dreissena polymorpha]|uniref:SH3 domain-containing protein n=2 Tax=Dreissena polymorpha TaxID=45954 RepID=A0A9D4KI76_DREPO|nr:hypothetical protein DPMN_113436 [Dreissena polymorpha]
MISDVESAISSTNALQETQNKMTENTSSVTMNFKRPTIIRPQRGFKTAESDENVKSNELSAEVPVKYVDKSSTDVEIRPRPATRPVSMMSVSYSKKDETEPTREANDLSTSPTGSADFLVPGHPSPLPRPTPRGRPKSVMLPQAARPPPPAARAQDDSSTGQSSQKHIEPSKPVSRPPPPKPSPPRVTKSQPEPDAPSERAELSATDRRSSLKRIGVSVFPPAVLQAASASKVKDQVKVYSDSSDEEFFMAPEKPERPSAGPRVSPAGPVQEASVEPSSPTQPANQVTKPPRSVVPGPNPDMPVGPTTHARKTSEQENEEVTEKRGKPPRPGGGPTRPTSVPVKSSAPPKPSPPKPAADGPTKKSVPTLPSRPGPGHPLYHHMMQTPHGVAMHDYTAQADDELPFKTGELLLLVRRIDADWLVGRLGDREGMFPQAFIKVKMPLAGEALEGDSQSEDSVEMSACASTEKPDNLGSGPRCRARFDFDGEGPDDLVFEDGDVIRLLERVGLEWRRGEMNGRQGLFPLAFVEIIEDLPANDNTNSTSKTVRAVFDFDGELGELSFQAGDAIQVTHIVNEEWLYGEMGPCRGQFPVQFVDHVPPGLPPLEVSNHGNQTCGLETAATSGDGLSKMNEATRQEEAQVSIQCVAVYDFPAQSPDDLPFSVGDHIEIVERIGADWARGRIGGRQGMFPVSFVEILHQTGSQQENDVQGQEATEESDMETGRRATALYDFTGEADNELTFLEGDIILVEGPMQGAEDWCWGVRRGNRGIFPAAFVEMVS